jgi:FkbM family methyltransferase
MLTCAAGAQSEEVDVTDWLDRATAIAPLLAFAEHGTWGGESGVLAKIFDVVPAGPGFAVEIAQRAAGAATVARLVKSRRWGVLYLDREAEATPPAMGTDPPLTMARHVVSPANINELFARYGVPQGFDCLVIDIDGMDYWVWRALAPEYRPALVVIEFNAHVPAGVAATLSFDEQWQYAPGRDYGASITAMQQLAAEKGYRLIHVHGPWRLYFLREDVSLPPALTIRQPLTGPELSVLTDTEPFYETLCGSGRRPTWFDKPSPDVSRSPWEILAPEVPMRELNVAGIPIKVLADKHDVQWYQQRKTHEERHSLLYGFLRSERFERFVDVGANAGYVSLVAALAVPTMRGIAIEADPRLVHLLRANLAKNLGSDAGRVQVVNAVVGDQDAAATGFSLNPGSTLDNRVTMPAWEQVRVPKWRLDSLLPRLGPYRRTFFKIDTQGYELHVLRGLESTLAAHKDWLLKMEFAPDWLRSQGTDPEGVLDHLQQRYEFAEFPERIPFGTPGVAALFAAPVPASDQRAFIEHVCSLSARGLGWVDLIVRPRGG